MLRAIPAPLVEILRSIESDHPSATFTMEGFCVRSSPSGRAYYVKLGDPADEEQYNGEAVSILHIARAAPDLCPAILRFGTAKFPETDMGGDGDAEVIDRPFWVSEYKFVHPLDPKSASTLAKRLALELHAYRSQNGACDGEASPISCRRFEKRHWDMFSWTHTRRTDQCSFQDNTDLNVPHTAVRHGHRGSGSAYAFMSYYPKTTF
jgi:hypothetical protein